MVYILLFACLVAATVAQKPVPLFIIDAENATSHITIPPPNPFTRLSGESFSEIVHQVIALRGTIVVFVEYKFCVEYVSGKDESGTPYPYLHDALQQGKVKYIPAALEPYSTLTALMPVTPRNEFHLSYDDGASNNELFTRNVNKSSYFYIHFKDRVNATLTRSLREHDLLMYEVYFSMRNVAAAPPLVAFYTGITNPVSYRESKRPVARHMLKKKMNTGGGLIFHGVRSLFVLFGVYHMGVQTDPKEDRVNADPPGPDGRVSVALKVQHNINANFVFYTTTKKWILDHIELVDSYNDTLMGTARIRISAPWNHSYVCGSAPIRIRSLMDGSLFIIHKYQIQLFPLITKAEDATTATPTTEMEATTTEPTTTEAADTYYAKRQKFIRDGGGEPEEGPPPVPTPAPEPTLAPKSTKVTLQFGPPLNCNKFMSIPIFEGLCVAFVFLGGIFVSVSLLWDVQGNMKFDDPRGARLIFSED